MTKPLFTFRDAWPWAALTAVALLVLALVAFYGQGRAEAYVVAFASAGAMLGIAALHFWRRWKVVSMWNDAPKLWHDVAVLSPCSAPDLSRLNDVPELVRGRWSAYPDGLFSYPRAHQLIAAMRGCDITFTAEPWTHNGVLVGGIQDGEHITVVGPEFAGIERTRALIIHELSHRALTALGIPAGVGGENHHRIFAEENLGC